MAVLSKKVKASTLMETLVASVLIVIIFMVASLVLNNVLVSHTKYATDEIEAKLNELEYRAGLGQLRYPYQENHGDWDIYIEQSTEGNKTINRLVATNKKTGRTLTTQSLESAKQ